VKRRQGAECLWCNKRPAQTGEEKGLERNLKMGECEDRKCQQTLNEVHQEVFGIEGSEGLSSRVKEVEDNQTRRTVIIDSKMPKSWLWTIILLVTPVTGFALTILISQVTADSRFANKSMVIKHD